jgi:tRNA threonylcarbamoyladenosine modification (KEOPS) complex  Pcc1 subunit
VTIAGSGSGDGCPTTGIGIGLVRGLVVDSQDNLFFTEVNNGILSLAPDGNIATVTVLKDAYGITVDSTDNLFVAFPFNNSILRVDSTTGKTTPVVIPGYSFSWPFGVAVDTRNDNLFIADTYTDNFTKHRILRVDLTTDPSTDTITGTITASITTGGPANDLAVDSSGNVFYATIAFPRSPEHGVWKWDGVNDPVKLATIDHAHGVGIGGSDLYIAAQNASYVYKLAGVADSGNQPPVAIGTSISQESRGCGRVKLDGTGSYDPDNDQIVSYTWTGPFGSATGATPTVTMPLGISNVNLIVNDGAVDSEPDTVIIRIVDTIAPKVRVKLKKKKKGCFQIKFSAKDICDADLTVVALLNGVSITNGQLVKLIRDDDSSDDDSSDDGKKKNRRRKKNHGDDKSSSSCNNLTLTGDSFTLEVTATDNSGNVGTKSDTFVFPPKHRDDCSSDDRKLKKKLKKLKKKWRKRYSDSKKSNAYSRWKKWRKK